MMTVKISNCGHDENNKYSGGAAGDQTGTEWYIRNIYGSWTYVFRHPTQKVRTKIATLATAAAKNDKIGYDQNQRTTFWTQLSKVGYDPSKITTKCEADCSSGVAAIVKATGYLLSNTKLQNVSKDMYTGNQKSCLTAAGFECIDYPGSSKLKKGDILWRSGHTATVVSGTSESSSSSTSTSSSSSTKKTTSSYTVGKTYTTKVDRLRVRKGAGTSYAAKSYSQLTSNAKAHAYSNGTLKKGTTVTCKAKKAVGSDVWIQIPSGWIAAYYSGKVYVG